MSRTLCSLYLICKVIVHLCEKVGNLILEHFKVIQAFHTVCIVMYVLVFWPSDLVVDYNIVILFILLTTGPEQPIYQTMHTVRKMNNCPQISNFVHIKGHMGSLSKKQKKKKKKRNKEKSPLRLIFKNFLLPLPPDPPYQF